jgi:hypothetical protein
MQYHFPAKMDAIKAAVKYMHVKRLSDQIGDLEDVPANVKPMAHAIEAYWKHLQEGHFVAYQDLVIAARTDPELAAVLTPAYQRFVKAWRINALKIVPAWQDTREEFEMISDIGQCLLEGLAFGTLNNQIAPERVRDVLEITKRLLQEMVE